MRVFKSLFIFTAILILLFSAVSHAEQLFDTYIGYQSGSYPYDVVAADLNGDDTLDLVSVNYAAHTLSVLIGNGDGTYATRVQYACTGTQFPFDVQVADMNDDGNLDLITAGNNGFDIFYGIGDGTFGAAIVTTIGFQIGDFVVADFNGDLRPDIASTHSILDSVSVSLNDGDSTYTTTRFDLMSGSISIVAAKFNADVFIDLAVSCSNGIIWYLENDQAGGFTPIVQIGGTAGNVYLGTADLNGDGVFDLAEAHATTDTVKTWINNGTGTFVFANSYFVGGEFPQAVAFGDFDADTELDMVISSWADENIKFFTGSGSGVFTYDTTYSIGGRPRGLCPADLDGDGYIDLAVAGQGTDMVAVLLNRSSLLLDVEDITDNDKLPRKYVLEQNYPNPFNPITTIKFALKTASQAKVEVFNLLGQSVRVLVDDELTAGTKQVVWDGLNDAGDPVTSGIYFYRINADKFVDTKKMVLLK
ncbi:MAG: T9SS type A sorting domain-containing protein [candidate division Zixibacteria bacterium]|nr:T9SS type A sorting domain-containing protein [candidate division Zixibacteria bacterium]